MSTVVDAVRPAEPIHGTEPHMAASADSPGARRSGEARGAVRSSSSPRQRPPLDWRRLAGLTVAGVVALLAATAVVLYWVGPLVHARDQRSLQSAERTAITEAAKDNEGLHRASLPAQPPQPGSVVGILAIPAIGVHQAVVEGVGPSQTVSGPGHVPGTAGLGQPGNSAVVGRRAGYGGPFASLGQLRPGDRVLTATTEGRSVYMVRSVRSVIMVTPTTASAAAPSAQAPASASTTTSASTSATRAPSTGGPRGTGRGAVGGVPTVSADAVLGPSKDDQLTLVTSGSSVPWNTDRALVVVARLQGRPYTPTPQEARSPSEEGNAGDPTALAWLILAVLALGACFAGALVLYRRTTLRSAYLLTTAPLLVLTVLAAEALSRLLPAWL
jgi:sortase A